MEILISTSSLTALNLLPALSKTSNYLPNIIIPEGNVMFVAVNAKEIP